jgi:predicted PurR-regulated permease PerM
MSMKTIISLVTGLFIGFALWFIGVDYPVLWGVLAFMLNFVPNIGSIIAAVPAVLLTVVQLGVTPALMVASVYIAVNIIVGSIIEPKYMGKGLGLSTLVVFVSLVFWGWVLGPVGMLLSVPLTITVKLALDSKPETKWLGHLLGPGDV